MKVLVVAGLLPCSLTPCTCLSPFVFASCSHSLLLKSYPVHMPKHTATFSLRVVPRKESFFCTILAYKPHARTLIQSTLGHMPTPWTKQSLLPKDGHYVWLPWLCYLGNQGQRVCFQEKGWDNCYWSPEQFIPGLPDIYIIQSQECIHLSWLSHVQPKHYHILPMKETTKCHIWLLYPAPRIAFLGNTFSSRSSSSVALYSLATYNSSSPGYSVYNNGGKRRWLQLEKNRKWKAKCSNH